jgi:hypothetical protein
MIIYIDNKDFKCYTAQNTECTHITYETDFFNGKCDTFIEGYRHVPSGYSWIRSDGEVFHGEMTAPWKPYSELDRAQREYEIQLLEQSQTELFELKSQKEDLLESYMTGVNSI